MFLHGLYQQVNNIVFKQKTSKGREGDTINTDQNHKVCEMNSFVCYCVCGSDGVCLCYVVFLLLMCFVP